MEIRGMRRYVVGILSVIAIMGLVSCAQGPESSPLFKKKMQELTDLHDKVQENEDKLRRMVTDLETLSEEVRQLSQRPAGEGTVDSAEVKRLGDEISKMNEKIAKLEKASTTPPASTTVAPRRTTDESPVSAVRTTSPTPKAEEPSVQPKGFYHEIQKDDTLSSIARKYNVSEEAILQANRLPRGSQLRGGSRLFIPASR